MQQPQEMHEPKIRVLIADDQELVRSGYRAILSTYSDFEIVGIAENGNEALSMAFDMAPDVVLMDIRMPGTDGIEATRQITSNPKLSDVHVLVLTTFDIDDYVFEALKAGASGFLLKDADPDDIAHAIRVVAAGDALIEPSITKRLIERFALTHSSTPSNASDQLKRLTERELEILSLVAKGISNEEIAMKLTISPATVKTHISRIMAKTDSHDRAQLVVFAYENGLTNAL